MANVVKLKRGTGSDPTASDMVVGEPVIRTDTAELFFKKDDGSVAKVSGGGGGPDFKYLALRNAANNGSASYPGNDFTLVTSGTTNAITPAAANTLLVSYGGVIQKPNSGTSTSGITGFIVDGSRIKTATNFAAAPDFILYQESGGIGEPSDETVDEAKLKVSNNPTNGYFLSAQSGNTGGLTWAAVDLSSKLSLTGGTLTGDLQIPHKLIHAGDTDTCMRFQTNIWSIEVGGNERIETNNTRTKFFHNIETTGTVDGVDIATRDTLFGGLTSSSGVLTNGVTATTQSASDNSTKVATTAYTDTAISNLVDSSPSALNTLNELAAALGDDANFSTTVTNSIATKLPLAGGTLTGVLSLTSGSQYPLTINGSHNGKIVLQGASNPYIRFREGSTDKAYIQWGDDGYFYLVNQEEGDYLMVGGGASGLKWHRDGALTTVWTSGNDGSGSGLDADTLDGQQGSYYLDYNNFSNKPTIPTNNNQLTNGAGYVTSAGIPASGGTFTGDIAVSGGAGALTVNANSDIRFSNGTWTGESTKIQHHSSWLYIQGGSNGIVFRQASSGANRWFIDSSGHFYPGTSNSYDIGTSSYRVRNLYVNDLHFSNEGKTNSVDGTWGDWTLQEGEETIFMINNRSGKRYKMALQEVV